MLKSKLNTEKDTKTKEMYEFVISNFDNAPFLCKVQDANAKHKELNRVFAKFVAQLRMHYEKLQNEKQECIETKNAQMERINKRRLEIEATRETFNIEELSIGAH
jgi:hypothetical protein